MQLRRPRGTDFGSPPLPAAGPHTAALTDANLEDPSHPGVRRAMTGLYRMFGRPPLQATPLTSDVAAAIRATATRPRPFQTGRMESESTAERHGLVDIALVAVMRDALLRRLGGGRPGVGGRRAGVRTEVVRLTVREVEDRPGRRGAHALPEPADDGGPGRDTPGRPGSRPRQRIRSVGVADRTPDSAQLRCRGVPRVPTAATAHGWAWPRTWPQTARNFRPSWRPAAGSPL